MNRLKNELYNINYEIDTLKKREEKVIRDIQKQFKVERDTLCKRKKQILIQIRIENELQDK